LSRSPIGYSVLENDKEARLEGYDVVTTEDEKVGKVVGTRGDYLIVESGTLMKSKHLLPQTFADVDESEGVVRTSIAKDMIVDSPKVNGEADETAIADHYGLAAGSDAPLTEGYGETVPDDPALGAEAQAERAGITPAPKQRAEAREGSDESGLPEESPALLTDRLAGVDEQEQQKR
jgi:hypothetical protein